MQTKAKTAPAKTAPKAKPAPAVTTAPAVTPAPLHENIKTSLYAGFSSFRNSDRKTEIGLGVSKYGQRPLAKLTTRMLAQLAATKLAYGKTPFRARGFDNAICAILINSGAYSYTGGNLDSGVLRDLPDSPVMLAHTDAALKFGNATK